MMCATTKIEICFGSCRLIWCPIVLKKLTHWGTILLPGTYIKHLKSLSKEKKDFSLVTYPAAQIKLIISYYYIAL